MSKIRLATDWNPETNCLHIDNPYDPEPQYGPSLWTLTHIQSALAGNSKTASTAPLHQVFYNTKDSEYGITALDDSNGYYDRIATSRAACTKTEQIEKSKATDGRQKV